ncbi:META domain-containing protein [Myroides marinus]|uniref:Heat shock protein HslJ n=1 Tax=Myroides marinus TaxID=703342 RepID=A0A1H6YCQ5_9FLAO|nr:META domain-containing protein [Myroides marinus]MDM1376279.1 META domain-containing protein [Myroides marinus]MDM1377922.1 META domain-containing protein [Myroides marinus]MDM1385193.1 META domain-containing protein [Myroides marinus]MDM1392406.1 META domain-containing protein [Myroides marinus]SEJ39058.1 Heat shock protein HslJ [Myroides marinus]
MKKTLLVFASVLALSVVSCKTAGEITETPVEKKVDMRKQLDGEWVLSSITTPSTAGKDFKALFSMKTPTLNFEVKGNKVFGNDGCNNIHGSFEVKVGNVIKLGDKMASTMMFCDGVADREFMDALKSTTNYDIVDEKLVLRSGDIIVLTFTRK